MEFIIVIIIIIIGGLLFLYFNIKVNCKINLTAAFVNININFDVIMFNNKIRIEKKIYYNVFIKKILNRKNKDKTRERYKHYLHYLKYIKYPFRIFIIKNISFYAECYEDNFSIAIEFYIVNNILKKPLLYG